MIDAGQPVHDFDAFFEDAYDRAVRMATMMLVGDRPQAEDIVSDVFLTAYKQWSSIDNPYKWLTAVIARRVIKASESSRRRQPILGRLWASSTSSEPAESDPVALAEQREDVRRVMKALALLPPQQRAVAVLWWLHDWQQKDIAHFLHIRPTTVSTHIRRAEETLRRSFGERGESLNYFSGAVGKEGEAL
ncbi:sigma-70 family RNA polymerase sigma factor [Streptomyces sp. NBC_01565]|uniref:RNA polymerase sigma factor n=1 Tax=unclassified Streptomyces TaxID=2593676 RepID=UPI002253FC59|nr:sigma-70 family RNA polymerase sigma factor [Streptomyces sp. NBC_01565]MCX4545766.1 sigma-70 family RNA polymerase sigma factor [Streptomyces sp. NBC_01565]